MESLNEHGPSILWQNAVTRCRYCFETFEYLSDEQDLHTSGTPSPAAAEFGGNLHENTRRTCPSDILGRFCRDREIASYDRSLTVLHVGNSELVGAAGYAAHLRRLDLRNLRALMKDQLPASVAKHEDVREAQR
jgi:hypothetical protein